MSFILSSQREPETIVGAFRRYRAYVVASGQAFPPGACAHALSEWYFNPYEHRCPHDAWLECVIVSEPFTGKRDEERSTSVRVRLLGAYHDGFIELYYPRVFNYTLSSPSCIRGLGDWLYDEFRVSPEGRLIHEIEWAGFPQDEGSHWLIEASDVEFKWIPK